MDQINHELLEFIRRNPTAFHTTASMGAILAENGYEELLESRPWNLEPGKGYFVCRNGSSIIAFRLGTDLSEYSFNIAAAHTDSPTFRLKELSELRTGQKYTRLNTEGYGGMLCSTWMDRPLSVAGRVLVKEADGSIASRLVDVDRDLLLIPSVAIHMNRAANDSASFNKQVDMLPLLGTATEPGEMNRIVASELGIAPEQILGSDLFLYVRDNPTTWGAKGEFISSGRLDDQQCAFSALQGLLRGHNDRSINVVACFDNEEVGSGTKQGAASTFLYDVLKRISAAFGSESDYLRALASSFMLSADNAHAVHPNHPEHTDANNCVYMNEGVVVKSHAGQKYTSDGMSIAIVRELASRAGVPLQYFANRSDKVGGSTLGNIAMAQVSLNCADIGLAQLAMHSCYETAGAADTAHMVNLMTELFSSHFHETASGTIVIEK